MKKNNRIFIIFSVISFILGILAFSSVVLVDDLQFTEQTAFFIKIGGCLGLTLSCVLGAAYVFRIAKEDKEIEIEEKDERNIAIRGRAAEMTSLIMSGILFVLLMVSFLFESSVMSLSVTVAMLIQSFSQICLIGYFSKRM